MAEVIPLTRLLYLVIPLALCWGFYYRWCDKKWELVIATVRMVAQLLLIGYALHFLFDNEASWIGLIVLVVMSLAASLIAVRPLEERAREVLGLTLVSVVVSSIFVLCIILYAVLELTTFYEPRTFIPIAGMIFSSAMNTVSLSAERYFNELKSGKSATEARAMAFKASMIPKINSFLAVGLVSLPGMMTGQILSGTSPLIAVRYQIMVMLMLLGCGGLAAGIFLWMLHRRDSKEA